MTPTESSSPREMRRRFGIGAAIALAVVTLAITVGIGVVRSATTPVEAVTIDIGPEPTPAREEVYVHVSGAVARPGLYVLHARTRVVDAIALAGGFVEGADESAVNLARTLSDGEQLVVPRVGEVPPGPAGVAGDGRVNLNTADVGALDTLPRIGAAMAQRIIQWRETHGRFTSVEDLLAVPGIGEKMLESLRDLVTI